MGVFMREVTAIIQSLYFKPDSGERLVCKLVLAVESIDVEHVGVVVVDHLLHLSVYSHPYSLEVYVSVHLGCVPQVITLVMGDEI
jgi:hypothetical protein